MDFVIYPRGFVGFDTDAVKAKKKLNDIIPTLRSLEFNRYIQQDNNVYPSNTTINELWKEYINNVSTTKTFAFRERILLAALSAFGTNSFYDWCLLQLENKLVAPIHKKFIIDIFYFITTGKKSIGNQTWLNLIRIDNHKVFKTNDSNNFNKEIYDYFLLDKDPQYQKQTTLFYHITEWTQQENGFDDLLGSLMVLFGEIN